MLVETTGYLQLSKKSNMSTQLTIDTEPKLLKYAWLKKKNKRILITAFKHPDDTFSVSIETTKLIGGWKERNIQRASVGYGLETFMVLQDIFGFLIADPAFIKATNREMGQLAKERMTCQTDIYRLHKVKK